LLCYAAAGSIIQFCALKRGDTDRVHKLGNTCNLKTHSGVLSCVRYAIITSSIVCLQRKQLPSTFTPLGLTLSRDNGTTIAFFDGHVVKSVDCSTTPMSDDQVNALAQLYATTHSNDYVVHALSGPRKTASTKAHAKGVYSVELQPLGQEAVRQRLDADRLYTALRYTACLMSTHAFMQCHDCLRHASTLMRQSHVQFMYPRAALPHTHCAVELYYCLYGDFKQPQAY
jgi:prepilin-type processing-associated H-X9-DG protein